MTILWCGSEDVDFPGNALGWAGPLTGRSAYARSSFRTANIYQGKSDIFSCGSISSCWMSFWQSTTANENAGGVGVGDYSSESFIGIGSGSTTQKVALYKYDGSTVTKLQEEPGGSATDICKIDMHIVDYSTNGSIIVYVNNVEVINYTGDVTVLSKTTFNCVRASHLNAAEQYYQEVIISDEDTRLMLLTTLVPNASGDSSQFTGAYTDVDETTINDTDLIYTNSVDQEFNCNVTSMPTGNFKVKAIRMVYRAAQTNFSINMRHGIRSASTTYLESPTTLTSSWQTKEVIYQNNPVTAVAFTPAEIDSLQFALKTVTA